MWLKKPVSLKKQVNIMRKMRYKIFIATNEIKSNKIKHFFTCN